LADDLDCKYRGSRATLNQTVLSFLIFSFDKVSYTGYPTSGVPPPKVCARHTPNFATSAAKLVCRASRKGYSTWPGLEPRPTSTWKLEFEAILNFSPSPKVVISASDRGVVKFLPLLNMSSKRPAAASIGSPSSHLPT
jgi:hypothetical protein